MAASPPESVAASMPVESTSITDSSGKLLVLPPLFGDIGMPLHVDPGPPMQKNGGLLVDGGGVDPPLLFCCPPLAMVTVAGLPRTRPQFCPFLSQIVIESTTVYVLG